MPNRPYETVEGQVDSEGQFREIDQPMLTSGSEEEQSEAPPRKGGNGFFKKAMGSVRSRIGEAQKKRGETKAEESAFWEKQYEGQEQLPPSLRKKYREARHEQFQKEFEVKSEAAKAGIPLTGRPLPIGGIRGGVRAGIGPTGKVGKKGKGKGKGTEKDFFDFGGTTAIGAFGSGPKSVAQLERELTGQKLTIEQLESRRGKLREERKRISPSPTQTVIKKAPKVAGAISRAYQPGPRLKDVYKFGQAPIKSQVAPTRGPSNGSPSTSPLKNLGGKGLRIGAGGSNKLRQLGMGGSKKLRRL